MNVSRAVAGLRKQGRVAERRDAGNRRRKLLTLTAEGQRLYRAMVPATLDALSALIDRPTRNFSGIQGAAA